MTTKRLVYQPDGNRPVFIDQVVRKPDRTGINNRRRLLRRLQIVENAQVRLARIFQHIAFIRQQHDQAFGQRSFLQSIYLIYRFRVRSVAPDPPDRISGIKDQPPAMQYAQTILYILFEVHTKPQIYPTFAKK